MMKDVKSASSLMKWRKLENGDASVHKVWSVSAEDVEKGLVRITHIQRLAWKKIQSEDRVHTLLLNLIENSKIPEKKKTWVILPG